jgi:hypothetical protein
MANNSDGGYRSTNEADNITTNPPSPSHHRYQNTSETNAEVHSPAKKHTFSEYDHLDDQQVPDKSGVFSVYDRLEPPPDSPYAILGNIEEVDLTSFAYQIASGMVGHTESPHGSGNEL